MTRKLMEDLDQEEVEVLVRRIEKRLERMLPSDARIIVILGDEDLYRALTHNIQGIYLPETLRMIASHEEKKIIMSN